MVCHFVPSKALYPFHLLNTMIHSYPMRSRKNTEGWVTVTSTKGLLSSFKDNRLGVKGDHLFILLVCGSTTDRASFVIARTSSFPVKTLSPSWTRAWRALARPPAWPAPPPRSVSSSTPRVGTARPCPRLHLETYQTKSNKTKIHQQQPTPCLCAA